MAGLDRRLTATFDAGERRVAGVYVDAVDGGRRRVSRHRSAIVDSTRLTATLTATAVVARRMQCTWWTETPRGVDPEGHRGTQ